MLKTMFNMLAGAAICAAVSAAYAVVGVPPGTGVQLVDGVWLTGLAGGQNYVYQNGLTATGSSAQSGALQLATGIALYSIDTVASNTGVALPPCFQGVAVDVYNNGASTLTVYPAIANNNITAAQDTINNGSSVSLNSHTSELFFCAKNGVWGAK